MITESKSLKTLRASGFSKADAAVQSGICVARIQIKGLAVALYSVVPAL